MKVIGLTGGIGSGKTTVAQMFQDLGIPVYIADDEAKKLMLAPEVQKSIIELLGNEAYQNNQLNRAFIASKVYKDKNLLDKLNKIVHPEVGKHFKNWLICQKSPYVIKEAAILFENGSYKNCFKTILVMADKNKRISRVIKRDQTNSDKILSIMENQWADEKKMKLADFIIENNADLDSLKTKVYAVHKELIQQISN